MVERPSAHTSAALETIWPGMPVVDPDGVLVGSVKSVRSSDPEIGAVTDQSSADHDLDTAFAHALANEEPPAAPELAEQLIGHGFLKVAGPGPMDHDRFVRADQIAVADEDSVRLASPAGELVVERERWL